MSLPSDKDHGTGDEEHFPAADLEKLYRLGGLDTAMRVQGSILNEVLGVTTYQYDAMYVVTRNGVKKL